MHNAGYSDYPKMLHLQSATGGGSGNQATETGETEFSTVLRFQVLIIR